MREQVTLTRVCLVQLDIQASKKENLARVLSSIETARNQADLIVFPEYCMGFPQEGLSRKYLTDLAEPITGEFVNGVVEATKRTQVAVVIPIFESGDGSVYNTAVVVDRGRVLGGYRKIHLFDALGSRESDLFGAGSNPVLFKVKEMVFGLVICYDIRFPELMRAEAMSGAQAVVAPSAWYAGPLKEEQWQSILMARAHENTIYVIGVGNANHAFVGRSLVADPLGVKVLDLGLGDGVGFYDLDERRISKAREMLPLLKQAGSMSYGRCVLL